MASKGGEPTFVPVPLLLGGAAHCRNDKRQRCCLRYYHLPRTVPPGARLYLCSLVSHEARSLFLGPGPLGFIEHNNALYGRLCCGDVLVAEMMDVLNEAGVLF